MNRLKFFCMKVTDSCGYKAYTNAYFYTGKNTHLSEENNDTITNVAISCGFSNMSWFSHVFKNIVGCTPVEYRRYVRN